MLESNQDFHYKQFEKQIFKTINIAYNGALKGMLEIHSTVSHAVAEPCNRLSFEPLVILNQVRYH